jgi:hypothetical protein
LAPIASQHPSLSNELQNVIVLLAYADPMNSTVKHLMEERARSELASQINADILGQEQSQLEHALRQTSAVTQLLAEINPSYE